MLCLELKRKTRWVQIDAKPGGTEHAVLIYVDGAAPSDGQAVRGGCGISYKPDGEGRVFCFPLERVVNYPLSSNRAELRVAHTAITYRH